MGQLVFQATLGGQVNLVGPNTASTFNLSVPATTSTLATTSGTETLTNKTLTSPTLTSPNITTALTLTGAAGTSGQVLTSAGTGAAPTWTSASATPGGSTTQVQYNNAGAFAGITGATTNGTALTLTGAILNGTIGATTPDTGVFTTLRATGVASLQSSTDNFIKENAGWVWNSTGTSGGTLRAYIYGNNANTLIGYANGGQFSLTSVGLAVTNSIGVGNTTPSSSGAGIAFPATQSASSDANTLDDYEEGTWTPVAAAVTVNSGTPVYSGTYTKIGRIVYITMAQSGGNITLTGNGTSNFSGLPFTVASASTSNALWSDGSAKTGTVYAYEGGTIIYILEAISSFTNLTTLRISATYSV